FHHPIKNLIPCFSLCTFCFSFLGTQLGVSASLKKCRKTSTDAGRQPFSGKSFYLDLPAGKSLQFLTGAIQQLGGVIEGFLSKEVSYIVSSRREAKAESNGTSPRGCPSPSEVRGQTPSIVHPKDGHTRPSQKPADSVPMSRGKELLQKAIRNQVSRGKGAEGGRLRHRGGLTFLLRVFSSTAIKRTTCEMSHPYFLTNEEVDLREVK
uniref:BRCT domain-containing protein n=1 Tax=Canis lupus dingo TaxID=286419 RepID=A0A8C0K9Y5_CANLU